MFILLGLNPAGICWCPFCITNIWRDLESEIWHHQHLQMQRGDWDSRSMVTLFMFSDNHKPQSYTFGEFPLLVLYPRQVRWAPSLKLKVRFRWHAFITLLSLGHLKRLSVELCKGHDIVLKTHAGHCLMQQQTIDKGFS